MPTPPIPAGPCPPRWLALLLPAALFVATMAAFFPALSCGLVDLDDKTILISNTRYRDLTAEHIAWMFQTSLMGHYQPLTWLSYGLDYQLSTPAPDGGPNPA